jgi:hypothetical protein
METVWKYNFMLEPHGTELFLDLPKGASILTAQMQDNSAVMWALVDTEMVMTKRTFVAYWTGAEMHDHHHCYINTVVTSNGLVYHLFEVL